MRVSFSMVASNVNWSLGMTGREWGIDGAEFVGVEEQRQ
jgi:hypothetical protein